MEHVNEFAQNPTLVTGMIIVIAALSGAIIWITKLLTGSGATILKGVIESNKEVASAIRENAKALDELRTVVNENTRSHREAHNELKIWISKLT